MDAILFKQRYDPARLVADLEAATALASWLSKPEHDRFFKWRALPLYSLQGGMGLETVHGPVMASQAHACAPTPPLMACPYFQEILEALPAGKLRVRLMKLEAGGVIGRHQDYFYGWERSILRLHIPITTHPDVEFQVNGKRLIMSPGELWYVDTTREHEVINRGPVDRVHLVIDLVNGPELRAQLGPATWERSV